MACRLSGESEIQLSINVPRRYLILLLLYYCYIIIIETVFGFCYIYYIYDIVDIVFRFYYIC